MGVEAWVTRFFRTVLPHGCTSFLASLCFLNIAIVIKTCIERRQVNLTECGSTLTRVDWSWVGIIRGLEMECLAGTPCLPPSAHQSSSEEGGLW